MDGSDKKSGRRPKRSIMKINFVARFFAGARRVVLPLVMCMMAPVGGRGAEDSPNLLRVGFFYNAGIFKDGHLRTNVQQLLTGNAGVLLDSIPYSGPIDFRQRFNEYQQTNGSNCALVLGPTESAALKALNESLTNKLEVPFLAPFITTPLEEYPHINLTTACPSDRDRVRTAIDEFVIYTSARTMAILHTDDLWGRAMVKEFRSRLSSQKTIVHAEPVEEFKGGEQNSTNDFPAFINKMRDHGATVIGVALLTELAVNQFLDHLANFNNGRWVPYKPTILLLSQPRFHPSNRIAGVLYGHLKEFNIFYVNNCLKVEDAKGAVNAQRASIAAYLDASEIIDLAAGAYSTTEREGGLPKPVSRILGFYDKKWEEGMLEAAYAKMTTGFHSDRLGFTNKVMAVVRVDLREDKLRNQAVAGYFYRGPLIRLFYSGKFFMEHNRALWNHWTLLLFTLVALMSFFHVIHLKSEKPPWMLLRTRPFWSLFLLNLLVTYLIWVLSIHFGVFGDSNVGAAMALAAACPTAASALGDIARRYAPMVDITGVIVILERINEQILNDIGKAKLDELTARLKSLNSDRLKSMFFDVLLLRLSNGDLRNRIREQLRKKLDGAQNELESLRKDFGGMTKEQLQERKEELDREMYSQSLLKALSYLYLNERELSKQVTLMLAKDGAASA